MDLRQLRSDGLGTLKIVDNDDNVIFEDRPADAPDDYKLKPVSMTFHGVDSDQAAKARAATEAMRKEMEGDLNQEQIDHLSREYLVRVLHSWHAIQLGDQILDCKYDEARRVFKEVRVVFEQARRFYDRRANFTYASAKG